MEKKAWFLRFCLCYSTPLGAASKQINHPGNLHRSELGFPWFATESPTHSPRKECVLGMWIHQVQASRKPWRAMLVKFCEIRAGGGVQSNLEKQLGRLRASLLKSGSMAALNANKLVNFPSAAIPQRLQD